MRKNKTDAYSGSINKIESILAPINHEIVEGNVRYIPSWIETYHLTLLTYIWVIITLIGGILSRYTILAVWLCIIALVGHIVTDAFDGALGRYRQTGLVRWGHYADHFGDYLLSCALVLSFRLIDPAINEYLIFFLVIVITGFFIHSLLTVATLNKFTLTFFKLFSPLEGQIAYVLVYLAVIIFGRNILTVVIPAISLIATAALVYLITITLNKLWIIDMLAKRRRVKALKKAELNKGKHKKT